MDLTREKAGRDEALAALAATRAELVARADGIAHDIVAIKGRVTSTEVWDILRKQAETDFSLAADLDACDPRWMGVVFRSSKGWERAGFEETGSHLRPVSIWVLA